ncbi:MAG: hypothetical protein Q9P44_03915 [Anaerolineae bacterium]|nr:hypothetical protein [Anaerolineae bacterium]
MSDQDNNSFQRFSRRNRKNRLPKADSLFPADDNPVESASESASEEVTESDSMPPMELDLEALSLPDTNLDALESLSKLSPDDVRAPLITPQAERYPPLNPTAEAVPNTPTPDSAKIAAIKARKQRNIRNNVITILAWASTIAFITWMVTIWLNPQTTWNPLPPQTPFIVITATTGAAAINPVTPTVNVEGQIFIVATEAATETQVATESPYPFIAPDTVIHVPNGNDLGCSWWSIAGTVSDSNGTALDGYRIRVVGEGVNESVFSGTILTFGAGGFELPLIGTPQVAEFTVQLFSPQDAPLSPPVTVTTRAECDANVAIVNFVQNR